MLSFYGGKPETANIQECVLVELAENFLRAISELLPHAMVGGADRDRTDDPLLAKQVLSQLSYSPTVFS
jgi:hypothetical protein